jgi:hypothetical protein
MAAACERNFNGRRVCSSFVKPSIRNLIAVILEYGVV